jgi:CBS domain-containing protein
MRPIRRILVAVKDPAAKTLPAVLKVTQLARACAKGANMNVGNICRRDITTITVNTPLADAARALCEGRDEAIVAIASSVRQPTAVGVITDRDILRAMLERGGDLSGSRVVDILIRNPLVLSQDEGIEDAMSKLRACGVEHAPVVGPGGTLCGAISLREILEHRLRATT